jgi:hypothetical protein
MFDFLMKSLISFILILSISPSAYAEVSTRVCLADGVTPLELVDPCIPFVYRPIMVGTRLTIIIDSNTDGYWEGGGELSIWDTNQSRGELYGRDYNEETFDWAGSRFPAAGDTAAVWDFAETEIVDEQEHDAKGFRVYNDDTAIAGDWFIVDYNAIDTGTCPVIFYDRARDWEHPLHQLYFTHVRTRDFDDDGIVNFKDFVLIGFNWRRTDCQTPENCSGTDLNEDGNVDFNDLKMFADFWLERTR